MIGQRHFTSASLQSETMYSQMWLPLFEIISLSIICLGSIVCDINTIVFVSVRACRVRDAFVASCATVH